jgi:hypothetical protein
MDDAVRECARISPSGMRAHVWRVALAGGIIVMEKDR